MLQLKGLTIFGTNIIIQILNLFIHVVAFVVLANNYCLEFIL